MNSEITSFIGTYYCDLWPLRPDTLVKLKAQQAVDIWTIPLDEPVRTVLSADEAARAARFRFERDRLHWTAARSALRTILARYVNLPAERLVFTLGPHGKPAIQQPIQFNLSHSHGWAMIAVSPTTPVGIDIEAIRENVPIAKLLVRTGETDLPSGHAALFQRWTLREARTKAAGIPLLEKPSEDIQAISINAPAGFAASVALVGMMPVPSYCGSL